jgi:crossover junction endodeoxyribonuclease RuvC
VRVIGIDPGSQVTGYGIVDFNRQQHRHVASGCIQTRNGELPERLRIIFEGITALIETHRPDELAIEMVFVSRNADSALKLGQARGVAMAAGAVASLPVFQYSPRQVKQAVVGTGSAAKEQMQHMVSVLLALRETPAQDAADALGVAICHGHSRSGLAKMVEVQGIRRGRLM